MRKDLQAYSATTASGEIYRRILDFRSLLSPLGKRVYPLDLFTRQVIEETIGDNGLRVEQLDAKRLSSTEIRYVLVPVAPLMPLVPLVPEEPLVPVVPLVPELPDVPVVPDVPDVALVPDVPVVPEVPEVPVVPELPDVPLVPSTPLVPEVPEGALKVVCT